MSESVKGPPSHLEKIVDEVQADVVRDRQTRLLGGADIVQATRPDDSDRLGDRLVQVTVKTE